MGLLCLFCCGYITSSCELGCDTRTFIRQGLRKDKE